MYKNLNEYSRADLIKGVDPRTRKYSKKVRGISYIGVTSDFVVLMKIPSVTSYPATDYIVRIKLVNLPDLIDDMELSMEEKVRLSLDGDIAISCTCPAYKYWGYEYILTQLSSNQGTDQNIYPRIRNPRLEGSLCKHSMVAARGFGKWWKRIAKDISDTNFVS